MSDLDPRCPNCKTRTEFLEERDGVKYFKCSDCRGIFSGKKNPGLRDGSGQTRVYPNYALVLTRVST